MARLMAVREGCDVCERVLISPKKGGHHCVNTASAVHASDSIMCIFGPRCCVSFNTVND